MPLIAAGWIRRTAQRDLFYSILFYAPLSAIASADRNPSTWVRRRSASAASTRAYMPARGDATACHIRVRVRVRGRVRVRVRVRDKVQLAGGDATACHINIRVRVRVRVRVRGRVRVRVRIGLG